jgi:hypothetical protein
MQPDSMGDLPECKTLNASQMVPLRLVAHTDNGDTVLYDNPCPYNPHSCRPIRLAFKPENSDSIRAEHERLKFYTLLLQRNIIWIISLNRSKKVVIKIGDVLILVKIIQVNCIGNLCLDFNFGKNLMKIVPYSINKGLMGPKLEFSA